MSQPAPHAKLLAKLTAKLVPGLRRPRRLTGGTGSPPPTARLVLGIMLLGIMLLGTMLLGCSPAVAQAVDPFAWFEQLFNPKPPPSVGKPQPEMRRAPPSKATPRPKRADRPVEKPADKPADKPAVTPTFFVAVLGDSLGQLLGQGLGETLVDRPDVAILRRAKANSGLVRDDYFDWVQAVRDLLASKERIDFAVMIIGSNDRQMLRDADGSHEPRSQKWLEIYGNRIEAIASAFHERKIPLVWVGLPVLKSERLAEDALAFNELYRAHAGKFGATYLDIWEAFADESGAYSATGPDINGQIVKLRTADGIHFTKAGARKLAHFVEPEIRRNLGEIPSLTPPATPDLGQPPAAPEVAAPGAEELPLVEPVAGPVLPLTAPGLAPGGELATKSELGKPPRTHAGRLIERVLSEGQPLDPKPGRVDDFSWPRP
jgi:hypothetical protein